MAGNKCTYLERAMLDLIFNNVSFGSPTDLYLALSTSAFSTAATGSSMNEVPANGSTNYARYHIVTTGGTKFTAASGSNPATLSNSAVFTFNTCNTVSWGTILSAYITDALSGGDCLYGADLTASKTIQPGDTATYAIGSLTITEL